MIVSSEKFKKDPCSCWKSTIITLEVKHCPSLENQIKKEIDALVLYTQSSQFPYLGRLNIKVQEIDKDAESSRE